MLYVIFYFMIVMTFVALFLALEDKLFPENKPKYLNVGMLIAALFWPLFLVWIAYLVVKRDSKN